VKARGIWRSLVAFLATEAGEEIWHEIRAALVGGEKPPVSSATPPAGGPPPVPVVAYGWFLADAGGTVLAAAGRFAAPFTFVQDGDGFSLKGKMNVNQVDDTTVEVVTDMVVE